jgi:hypothetical protein
MITKNNSKFALALREAIADTLLALLINTPLNFAVIAYSFNMGWSATETSVILTVLFTTLAILRKTIIRLRFDNKHG